MTRVNSRLWAVSAAAWAVCGAVCLNAQPPKPSEYQVKAAYLFGFGRFVEWHAGPVVAAPEAFAICVLGADPFGATLDATVAGVTLDGKSVVTKRLTKARDATGCRIVFISASENGRLNDILMTLDRAGVLTVSDMPEFTSRGGMIQFVMEGNRVRFEVNQATSENAGLALSSELLKVATTVRKTPRSGG